MRADFPATILVLSHTAFEPDDRAEISCTIFRSRMKLETAAQWRTSEKKKPIKYKLRNS